MFTCSFPVTKNIQEHRNIKKFLTSCVESKGGEGDISSSVIVDGEMVDPGDDMEREDKKNKEVEHSEGTEKEQEQVY